MSNAKQTALEITRDIVVAALNGDQTSRANAASGKDASEMFQIVYNAVYQLCSAGDSK